MATLMTFIDPSLPSAKSKWWDNATKVSAATSVVRNVQDWRQNFVIRREKSVLANLLTNKSVTFSNIGCTRSELFIYDYYEKIFMVAMKEFSRLFEEAQTPQAVLRQKETFTILMACMSCMRMSLIHPIIPRCREVTIAFSPSRRNNTKVRITNIFVYI